MSGIRWHWEQRKEIIDVMAKRAAIRKVCNNILTCKEIILSISFKLEYDAIDRQFFLSNNKMGII